MAKENSIQVAQKEIENALNELVGHKASSKVHVFETEWGNLRALVGDDCFRDKSPGMRLEFVWEYIRKHVSEKSLKHLYGVHPMDLDEYDRQTIEVRADSDFPQ